LLIKDAESVDARYATAAVRKHRRIFAARRERALGEIALAKVIEAARVPAMSPSGKLLQTVRLAILAMSILAATSSARADAVSELAGFSVFPKVDLAQLNRGDAKPLRSGSSGGARYLAVQTAYVAPDPPAELLSKMRSWNPSRHPELKVYLHGESATDYSRLQNAPSNSAVRYLASATAQRSSDLQLSAAEMKQLSAEGTDQGGMSGVIGNTWAKILSERARVFASGGSSAQPPYDNSTPPVRVGEELSGLLRGQEKIRRQFSGLLEATGIGRGAGSIKPDLYWELLSADEKGVLTLGAHYSRAGAGGMIQTANALYYASGGYYAGITLHQLWPVEVEGQASTLVWRGDMISSASVGSLRGIERIAAESTMIKDISRVVSFFRRDSGSTR